MKKQMSYKIHVGDIVSITSEGLEYLEVLEPQVNVFEVVSIGLGDACEEGKTDCSCNHYFTVSHLYNKNIRYSGLILEEINLIDLVQNRTAQLRDIIMDLTHSIK